MVFGDLDGFDVIGADKKLGAFFSPVLFRNNDPFNKTDCHNIEAFGPVSTLMPYKDMADAIELAKMGRGSLVSSISPSSVKLNWKIFMGFQASNSSSP